MTKFPAIIRFSTQRQAVNASDYLSLTFDFLDSTDFNDKEEVLNQLYGLHHPVDGTYKALSQLSYDLVPKELRNKIKVEEVQNKLNLLTDGVTTK